MSELEQAAQQKSSVAKSGKSLTIYDQVEQLKPQLVKMIPVPSHIKGDAEITQFRNSQADRVVRIVQTELRKNHSLQRCDPASIFGAVLTCVQLDLEPGPLGYAYLVPYKGVVSLQVGYRGMLELVERSGKIETIYTHPVFEGDKFKYSLGLTPNLEHEPHGECDAKKMTHVYAVAYLKGSATPRVEVMSRKQIDEIKNISATTDKKGLPWTDHYVEMARKTVLKRLCKTLPVSTIAKQAIASDETHASLGSDLPPASIYDLKGDEEEIEVGAEG